MLAEVPDVMLTSAAIAEKLNTSPVMVRRVFALLHGAGLITQRKGPTGGARLAKLAREIGLGEVYLCCASDWPVFAEKPLETALGKVRKEAVAAMNETSIATLAKKLKKESVSHSEK